MPRKPIGDRPLTPAERQAKQRQKRELLAARMREALVRIQSAKTVREARAIALEALEDTAHLHAEAPTKATAMAAAEAHALKVVS